MTTYWKDSNGAFWTLEPGDGGDPSWISITHGQWVSGTNARDAALQALVDGNVAQAQLDIKHAYDTLSAIHGIPLDDLTIRTITGYRGP